jgi:hypothetical protein
VPQLSDRPNPRSAFYAWKTTVAKRASYDAAVLAAPVVREAWTTAYFAGARDALKASAKLADLVPQMRDLIYWLESDYEWLDGSAVPEDEQKVTT